MGKTTLSPDNNSKPVPRWFRRLKNVLTIIFDASIVIALMYGYTENCKEILVARVVFSALMNSLNELLANGQEYAPAQTAIGKKNNIPQFPKDINDTGG